jgi:spiro-SPASM protein
MDRIVVSAFAVTPYLNRAFGDGITPVEHACRRIESLMSISGIEQPPLLITAGLDEGDLKLLDTLAIPDRWERHDLKSLAASDVYDFLFSALADTENILWARLDAPFMDPRMATGLTELHRSSWCDYTFADGYPAGYSIELLRREVLPVMKSLAQPEAMEWSPGVLFRTLQRDINAFDIETEASPEDYTLFRASLTVDTRQNYTLCLRLLEHTDAGMAGEDSSILQVLLQRPELRRTLPYYYQVQVTTELSQEPTYQPWRRLSKPDALPTSRMSVETWDTILSTIAGETPECTIALGYGGEPACHPDIDRIIASAATYPGISLYVETSGIGWSDSTRKALPADHVRAVIVELDAHRPETYRQLRNGSNEELQEAAGLVEWLAERMPGRVFVQATRMTDNEWELQEFYRYWNERNGVSVIIQKYNSFAGLLPDRKVADLSPLSRIPCRHLERDMVILVDASVPRCFQDIRREHIRGSFQKNSFAEIWEAGKEDFSDHLKMNYPEMCTHCDEYYTFNA